MKYRKIFFLIFVLILLISLLYMEFRATSEQENRTAHIYIDFASTPALFQMIDALKQNPKDPKLMIFKRFKALEPNDETLLSINAQMIDVKFLGEKNYDKFAELVNSSVGDFYKKHSDYKFVFHLNAFHVFKTKDIFDIIPHQKVKTVHLYDDSIGRSAWDTESYENYTVLSLEYNTYFHAGHYDPEVLPIDKKMVISSDFQKSALELSEKERTKLAKMAGLDLKKMKILFKNRPVAVFLDDPFLTPEISEDFIKKLIQKKSDIKNYTWIYKNHPRISERSSVFDTLTKYFKNVTEIPNAVPLETLILVGLTPDYLAGYGSSVFYSFRKNQILGYIQRKELEDYKQPLLDLGILTTDIIFNPY